MAPDPNRRLIEFGPLAEVELDNSADDEMASPETTAESAAEPAADGPTRHGKAA